MRLAPALLLMSIACGGGEDSAAPEFTAAVPIADRAPIPYPPELFSTGIEGEVTLYLVIDTAGGVVADSTRIEESSGQAAFDAAALQAAPLLRFIPATIGDSAVAGPLLLPIHFTLPDSLQTSDGQ